MQLLTGYRTAMDGPIILPNAVRNILRILVLTGHIMMLQHMPTFRSCDVIAEMQNTKFYNPITCSSSLALKRFLGQRRRA